MYQVSIIAAYIAGMVALFAPCCVSYLFPAYLGNVFKERKNVIFMTLVYSLGIFVIMMPIVLGAKALQMLFFDLHDKTYLFGGVFMLFVAGLSFLGIKLPMPHLAFNQKGGRNDVISTFTLGIFSGITSACCAPVLVGVLALSSLSPTALQALGVGAFYVLGMVTPLYLASLLIHKRNILERPILKKVITKINIGSRVYPIFVSNIIATFVFGVTGVLMLWLTTTGRLGMSVAEAESAKAINNVSLRVSELVSGVAGLDIIFVIIVIYLMYKFVKSVFRTTPSIAERSGVAGKYVCPMHSDVVSDKPGQCPKCGMALVPVMDHAAMGHDEHVMKSISQMSWREKFKMSMTMAMGMEHGGLAGREMAKLMEEDIRNKFFVALILTLPIIAYSPLGANILGLRLPEPIPASWIMFLLTTPVYFYAGWIFLYSTYKALSAKILNMAVLIAVGITAAYAFSVVLTFLGSEESFYEAAAMLTTFVLFGHWMEMRSRRGTTDALQALFNLVPPQTRLWKDGKEVMALTSEVKVGDTIILKPGDKVPVDGVIVEGETAIDESLVTGESLPVTKSVGDKVVGGSINTSGSVKFKATKVGKDTALAQIVKMVETAQNSKAPGQKIADRFARYLVVVAVGGGLVTFAVWFFILGQPLMFALTFAISAVVIACPDALGLATPTAVAVGTGLGAKHNILIKDAPTLEQVSKVQSVVLDKTGTLTEGKPRITDVVAASGFTKDQVIQFDGAAEAKSSHPLSLAVLEEVKRRKISVPTQIEKFKNLAGHGVEATVDGKHILVGTIKLMNDRKINLEPLRKDIDRLLLEAKTIMILAVDKKIVGVVAALDPIKENAKQAVTRMRELGLEVAMITGDNKKTAEAIGKQLNIDRVFSEVLPEDKASYVKKMQQEGKFTAMVGDGVNDAPALAQADIGIAIGAGTDVAIETANVVLMRSDPADVLRAIKLSKATVRKMKQNLFWASIYNLLAIPIAAGVLYPAYNISLRPEISALLMSISSIIVATNAVLLNRVEKDLAK